VSRLPDLRSYVEAFDEHEVLNSASAIAFQALSALIPIVLVLLAALGFFDLERVWDDAASELRPQLSPAAFTVLDDTVRKIVTEQQPFWLTAGLAFAIWRLSSAMRAVMGALDRIYGADRERPLRERLRVSVALSLVVAGLLLGAIAAVQLGPLAVRTDGGLAGAASLVVRWAIAAALLLGAVAVTLRHAPASPQPLGWVSFGSGLAVGSWLVASAAFVLYVTEIASYGSLFGSFATLFVLLTYLYLAAIALLAGVELDAQVRVRS